MGYTNFGGVDVSEGYKVNGVVVIDENGNIDAPITTTDATFSGNTTLGDTSADTVTLNGTTTLKAESGIVSSVAGVYVGLRPVIVQQALSGAGAVNITTYNTAVTSTGANALTLADSTVLGQQKRVQMVVDGGGDATLTFNTNATIVFADVGDVAELVWNGADWIPVALYNMADGTTAPVYTPAS